LGIIVYSNASKKSSLPTLYLHYTTAKEDVGALNDRSVRVSLCLPVPDNQEKLVSVRAEC